MANTIHLPDIKGGFELVQKIKTTCEALLGARAEASSGPDDGLTAAQEAKRHRGELFAVSTRKFKEDPESPKLIKSYLEHLKSLRALARELLYQTNATVAEFIRKTYGKQSVLDLDKALAAISKLKNI